MLNGNAKRLYAAVNQQVQVLLMGKQKYKQNMSLKNLPMTLLG
jgi:hypothetical protein